MSQPTWSATSYWCPREWCIAGVVYRYNGRRERHEERPLVCATCGFTFYEYEICIPLHGRLLRWIAKHAANGCDRDEPGDDEVEERHP